jgi:hypothetical protein
VRSKGRRLWSPSGPPLGFFLSPTKSSALDTPCWAPSIDSIFFEDYLDFTSGYQDPLFIIPECSQTPQCTPSQANPSASSGNPANSAQGPDVYGSGNHSIDWDFALFSSAGLEPTSLPFSSAALTDNITSHDLSLNHSTSWDAFSLSTAGPGQYLSNDSLLLSGGSIPLTTSDECFNTMAISTSMGSLQDATFSTPMVKGNYHPRVF